MPGLLRQFVPAPARLRAERRSLRIALVGSSLTDSELAPLPHVVAYENIAY